VKTSTSEDQIIFLNIFWYTYVCSFIPCEFNHARWIIQDYRKSNDENARLQYYCLHAWMAISRWCNIDEEYMNSPHFFNGIFTDAV